MYRKEFKQKLKNQFLEWNFNNYNPAINNKNQFMKKQIKFKLIFTWIIISLIWVTWAFAATENWKIFFQSLWIISIEKISDSDVTQEMKDTISITSSEIIEIDGVKISDLSENEIKELLENKAINTSSEIITVDWKHTISNSNDWIKLTAEKTSEVNGVSIENLTEEEIKKLIEVEAKRLINDMEN